MPSHGQRRTLADARRLCGAAEGDDLSAFSTAPASDQQTGTQITRYVYNHLNQQTSTTDPDGNTTSFTYDPDGDKTSLTDADGNTTNFTYDNLNREVGQSRVTYEYASAPAVAVSESMTYDAAGNETSATNYDGQTIFYKYDNLNRQTQELWGSLTSPSATFTYTYDADGELTSAAAPTTTDTLNYNNLGEVTSDSVTGNGYAAPVTIASGYDLDGNRTTSSLSFGSTADYTNTYTYDKLDRETKVSQAGSTGGDAVAPKSVAIAYNADDQFSTITRYNDTTQTAAVASSAYSYNGAGDLTSLTNSAQSATIAGYAWTYNTLGEITTFSNSQHASENLTYSYDTAGQLTGATDSINTPASTSYSYDATGNRQSSSVGSTTSTSTTGANNTLITDGTYNYQYDAQGNRVEETNIATGAYTVYAYDFRQELTTATSYTTAGVVTQAVSYTYDAYGRQISETVAIVGGATTETKFVYDGQNIVATLNGTNSLTNRYLDGPSVDQVFADEQFTPTSAGQMPTAAGTVIWPLVDDLGTDRDLVEYNAATGLTSVVDHLAYSAYGAVTGETNAAISYLFGYTGFVRDLATGLDKSDGRFYDPIDGLWTQNDRIGFGGGQTNLNAYVGNNATANVDPTGASAWTRFFGVLKVIGGGVELTGGAVVAAGGGATEVGSLGASTPASVPMMLAGGAVMIHGFDTMNSGVTELWTGEPFQSATSAVIESATGSRRVGDVGDAALGLFGGGLSSSALARTAATDAEGFIVAYRGMTAAEFETLSRTSRIAARGGPSASPGFVGRAVHSLTYNKGRLLPYPQVPYSSGYTSVSLLPGASRRWATGADELVAAMRVPAREALLTVNPWEGEFLLRGGTQIQLIGSVDSAASAANSIRLTYAVGAGIQAGSIVRGTNAMINDSATQFFNKQFGAYSNPGPGLCTVQFIIPVSAIAEASSDDSSDGYASPRIIIKE